MKLPGEWECSRLKQVLQIHQDGNVRLIDTKSGHGNYLGTYELDEKEIIFTFRRFSRPVTRKIKRVNSSKLVLLDVNGVEEIYLRTN